MTPLSVFTGPYAVLAKWAVIAALLAAFGGWCYTHGVSREADRRDAQELAAVNAGIERHLAAVKTGQAAVKTEQAAAARAKQHARTLQEQINATPNDQLAGCPNATPDDTKPGPTTASPAGPSGSPGGVLFSARFVRLWDAAWTGADGQPVFGDSAGAAAAPSSADSARPGVDAKAVLSNQTGNAQSCSDDRRRLNRLIDLIEQLERDWDKAGPRP